MKNLYLALEKTDFVIANYKTKIELLKIRNTKPWLNFKILTPQEVINMFLGTANDRTFNYILEKKGLSYYHAKLVNANIIFPKFSNATPKTKELSSFREQLISEGYFDEIKLAKVTFFEKRVLLTPELSANKLLLSLLESAACKVTFIPELFYNVHTITKYQNGIIESYALLNKIASLIDSGVEPNKITIITKNHAFKTLIRAFAPSFKLKIEGEKLSILSFPEVQRVINNLKDNELLFQKTFEDLLPAKNRALIALKSLYLNLDPMSFPKVGARQFFIEKVKAATINETEGECITFSSELPLFSTADDYYFIPNFAEGSFSLPSTSFYLNAQEKIALGLNSAEASGQETSLRLTHSLHNLKNVFISFSPLLEKDEFTLLALSEKLNFKEITFVKDQVYYSQAYLNYVTGNDLDTHLLFNKINDTLSYYCFNNRDLDSYNSFEYRFKGINYRPKTVNLSYSRINIYQRNPFDYFAQYLLGLTDDFNNSKVNFGNFVHEILETSQSEATFKFNFYRLLDDENITPKDRFYILNREEFIFKVFQNYLNYIAYAKPSEILTEEPIKVKINDDCSLEGRIDNLFIFERDEKKHLLVVDYKTGTINNNENLYQKGLHLQLPLYGLLLKLSPKFQNASISGLVYSSLKLPPYTLADEAILSESAWSKGRFTGSVLEGEALNIIDPTLNDKSEYFKGIKRSNGEIVGTISQEKLNQYIALAENKVLETYHGIKNSEFKAKVELENRRKVSDYGHYRNISYLPLHDLGEDDDEESKGEDDE